MVSLTFDDGPDERWTPPVLDALARAGISATFFVVAEQIAEPAGPELLRAIASAGHRIEAHCSRHIPQDERDRPSLRADIAQVLDALEQGQVRRPLLWRPPYGRLNRPHSFSVAEEVELQLVLWTCDPRDYDRTPWREMQAVVETGLYEDSVILLHDSRRYAHTEGVENTVALIEPLAELVRERGFDLGPLDGHPVVRSRRAGEDHELVPSP
jgi:peptidoglycan/xylan/chitin deacetylase (PgdA/CDA1 family)